MKHRLAARTISAIYVSLLLATLAISREAAAFPELIRHGYVTCINCHTSPTGGGALNDYGRTFSGEGLSTWSHKGEESVFHGLVKRASIPSWLDLGGDVRAVQLHHENEVVREGRWIWMQADLEAAARFKGLTFDLSLGRFQRGPEEPRLKSRRYFLMYDFTETIRVRAGRFLAAYGLNLPDHIANTRSGLRFDQGLETQNIEASWITDTWSVIATALKGPIELPEASQEDALALQATYAFWDTYKVGANIWAGKSDVQERQMIGAFATLGFTPEFYLMSEFDVQSTKAATPGTSPVNGYFTYNRLGYEVHRGVHLLGTVELWKTDMTNGQSASDRYGAGVLLYPRPHFEIQAIWTKFRTLAASDTFDDYAWALFHYYF